MIATARLGSSRHCSVLLESSRARFVRSRNDLCPDATLPAGLIIPDSSHRHGTAWRILTRRGRKLQNRGLAAAYRASAILPATLVHPEILEKSHAAFMRGATTLRVFAAFKAIEVAVRTAGGFPDGELGVPLMRKAFHPETGPLTDKAVITSERVATAALFAGAIGVAKNPTSYREFE